MLRSNHVSLKHGDSTSLVIKTMDSPYGQPFAHLQREKKIFESYWGDHSKGDHSCEDGGGYVES